MVGYLSLPLSLSDTELRRAQCSDRLILGYSRLTYPALAQPVSELSCQDKISAARAILLALTRQQGSLLLVRVRLLTRR